MGKTKVRGKQKVAGRNAKRAAGPATTTVTVTFRHVEPSDAIRRYAERKLAHLGKFLKRTCEAHVILSVDKYRQHGEVTVKSGRLSATAEQESKDLYSVIDLLEDKVVRQLRRHREKIEARKVRTLSTGEILSAKEEIEPTSA
ncbi:MAG: ribosome hibernation-promoting factor, HPF/YfiA family [Candidatus Binataceae bacterium]